MRSSKQVKKDSEYKQKIGSVFPQRRLPNYKIKQREGKENLTNIRYWGE